MGWIARAWYGVSLTEYQNILLNQQDPNFLFIYFYRMLCYIHVMLRNVCKEITASY